MVVLRIAGQKKIWHWLEPQITSQVLEQIKEDWPGIYDDIVNHKEPVGVVPLSVATQIVLDAMAGRASRKLEYTYADGLPKSYLVEIAQKLNVDARGLLKWKLAELVVGTIEETKSK